MNNPSLLGAKVAYDAANAKLDEANAKLDEANTKLAALYTAVGDLVNAITADDATIAGCAEQIADVQALLPPV